MKTMRLYRLDNLSISQFSRLKATQQEAAQVWNCCMQAHKAARQSHEKLPSEKDLGNITKGRFALHSQTVQAIVRTFVANVDTTRQLKPSTPKMRYPYKTKRFYPVMWPAQAVCKQEGRIVRRQEYNLEAFLQPGKESDHGNWWQRTQF